MFSKNAPESAADKDVAPEGKTPVQRAFRLPHGRRSLALRLTLFYTAAASLMLVASSLLVYFAIANYLANDDDRRLEAKLSEIQAIIRRSDDPESALGQAVGFEDVAESLIPFLIRIKDAQNEVVVQTPRMERLLPVGVFDSAEAAAEAAGADLAMISYSLVAPNGHAFLARRCFAVTTGGREFIIHGAVDHDPETHLLRRYRGILIGVNSLGLLGCAVIGYFVVRRVLRPLDQIGQAVLRIRSDTLNQRLQPGEYPAELAALATRFNRMLQGLEDAFGRLARYSADIAHELRTPVNNLRGEAEVALGRARSPDEYREVLGSCLEECQRLSSLIDSLLFIARVENPSMQIRREKINLRNELDEITEFYSVLAADANIELRHAAPENLTCPADRHLFRRAVGNLIENSLKYCPPGGQVVVRAVQINADVHVTVADNGKGIPPEHLPHIFDRFYRVDADRSKETGGLGLGLAIVKTIATLHNGRISLESRLGQGTTATLVFPVEPAKA
jgi:two-component system, OmpR family, heavy metal sensor histidine kinase CusS